MPPNLSGRAEWFIVLVFFAGSFAFTASFFAEPLHDPFGLATTVALTCVAEALAVRLHQGGKVSISTAGIVVAGIVWGLPGAALASATVTLTGWAFAPRAGAVKLAFNFGQHSLASLAGPALLLPFTTDQLISNPAVAITVGVGVGMVIFGVSSSAVTGIIGLTSGKPLLATYKANFPWLVPHYAALGAVGGGLGVAYHVLGIAGLAILAIPLLLARYSMKQVLDQTRDNVLRLERSNQQLQGAYLEIRTMSDELSRAYTGTLESLVAALDVRDQETRGHSVRVATHSLDIARMLGIKDEQELATIYRGALMHDVGKIGVPDAILLKPSKLTDEEWEFMRRHPAMGYRILAQVPYLRPTAKIVLAHHERWDGDGYPRRLKGEDIPLGARIFAICDTYDAIISDRPYRKGQEPDAAFQEILRCAGSQFDPRVVEAFEAAFPRWREEEVGGTTRRPLYLPSWRREDDEDAADLAAS
ncbi:MAG: HD-GYP domain-containing protein [Dehalococcoidia bacterium]|nr:HD-GYP domain-containing protein [Dehalococcoidia bacterium]